MIPPFRQTDLYAIRAQSQLSINNQSVLYGNTETNMHPEDSSVSLEVTRLYNSCFACSCFTG